MEFCLQETFKQNSNLLTITGHIKNMDYSKNLCLLSNAMPRAPDSFLYYQTREHLQQHWHPFQSWAFQTRHESLDSCTDLCLPWNISNSVSVLCPSPSAERCGSGGSKASKLPRCFPSKPLYGLTKTRSADVTQQLDESNSFLQGWWHRAFLKLVGSPLQQLIAFHA